MNEEQSTPGKPTEAGQETSKVFLGNSALQSEQEREINKADDNYYAVDKVKKEAITNIGDGEMRNEGIVGSGDIPEDTPLFNQGHADEQDKAELRDSGN